jgi:hypothetical protein
LTLLLAAISAQMLTWDQYRDLAGPGPEVLRLRSGTGTLLYYGARHSRDPLDPQVRKIEDLWSECRPTIALAEGGLSPLAANAAQAVARYGEAGLVRFLASRDRIPVASLDPSDEEQVAALLLLFPPDRVKLFYLLRRVVDLRRQTARGANPDALAEAELRRLSRLPGLHGGPQSLRDVAAAVPDWRDVPDSWFDPLRTEAFTSQINRELSQVRNRHMVKLLTEQMAAGHRVFAVVGRTHLVMQEPALRSAITSPE